MVQGLGATPKAYLESEPNLKIAEGIADENGFFQVILPNAGSYILKIDYAFEDTFIEYTNLHNNAGKLINIAIVTEGKITNVNAIYTSLRDVYISKVMAAINIKSNVPFIVEVRKPVIINIDHEKIMAAINSGSAIPYPIGNKGFYLTNDCTREEQIQYTFAIANILSQARPSTIAYNINTLEFQEREQIRDMYNYLVDNYDTTVAVVLPKR